MARPKSKHSVSVPALSPAQSAELLKRADKVTSDFVGPFEELESALGMLLIGRLVGWKVLVLIHNKRTLRKYEEILGISIREAFPETGPLTHKSAGYEFVQKLGSFWKAVSGEVKVEGRREMVKG